MKWIGYFLILAPCQWFEIYISLAQLQSALESRRSKLSRPYSVKIQAWAYDENAIGHSS